MEGEELNDAMSQEINAYEKQCQQARGAIASQQNLSIGLLPQLLQAREQKTAELVQIEKAITNLTEHPELEQLYGEILLIQQRLGLR
jgi:hypothetical protein